MLATAIISIWLCHLIGKTANHYIHKNQYQFRIGHFDTRLASFDMKLLARIGDGLALAFGR